MNINRIAYRNSVIRPNFTGNTQQETVQEDFPKEKVNGLSSTLAAFIGSNAINLTSNVPTLGLIIPAMKKKGNLSETEIKALKEGTTELIKKTGLDKHGVNIKWFKPFENPQSLTDIIKADLRDPISSVKNGRNAFFVTKNGLVNTKEGLMTLKKNTILMPEKEITYAVYHELGHAMNANLSKFGKTLQSIRPLAMFLPSVIALYGACSRKSKPNADGKLTTTQKINNAIRNNAGIIAFATTIPMLLEEGMATKNGLKQAKELLKPDLYKKVVKGNAVAYLSYITASVFAGIGAWSAVKIKDKLIAKKERKQEELYQAAIAS